MRSLALRSTEEKGEAHNDSDPLHQPHLYASAVTTRTKSRLMVALLAQQLPLLEQIAAYDEEIERLFLSHEDNEVFSSLPGAGKRLAPLHGLSARLLVTRSSIGVITL